MQPVQPACTAGATRPPQVSPGQPLDELAPPLLVDPAPAPLLVAPDPQGLTTLMHTLAGLPSTVETGVQAWAAGQACPSVQSRAQ
jgi:hypothetical protein